MAEGFNKFTNEQQILLSIGPFGGLDTTSSPLYVGKNNAVVASNVSLNRVYGSYCTQQGRTANIGQSKFTTITTPYCLGIIGPPIQPSPGVDYTPGLLLLGVNVSGVPVCQLTSGVGAGSPGLTTITLPATITSTPWGIASRWVFAGSYAFPDVGADGGATNNFWVAIDCSGSTFAPISQLWGITSPSAAPTVAAGAAGNLTGVYYYAVTFVGGTYTTTNSAPSESSPSPFTSPVTLTAQQSSLTGIPVSTDTQVVARNIYRFGGTIGGTPLLVGTIANNTTTTYTDNLADGSVVGQQLILRKDPAPTTGWQSLAHHKGRMWGFGTPKGVYTNINKSDLWYSNYLDYTTFNSVTQVIDVEDNNEGDVAIALEPLESVLVCFKYKSTYFLYGDSQNDFVARKVFTIGCITRGSVASGYGVVYWLSSDGVYAYDGSKGTLTNISDGTPGSSSIRSTITSYLNQSGGASLPIIVRAWINNRTYCISFYDVTGTTVTATYIWDMVAKAWTTVPYAVRTITSSRMIVPSATTAALGQQMVAGVSLTTTGQIDSWFSSETDLGNPIVSTWTTGVSDSGAPHEDKDYRYIYLEAPTDTASTVNVSLIINPGPKAKTLGPYAIQLNTSTNSHRISLPPGSYGKEAQITITATTTAKTIVDRVIVMGYVKRTYSPNPL